MQLFSADATIFLKKKFIIFLPPKHRKTALKIIIIPLDQKFLVQKVFGSVELRQFFTLFFSHL